MGDIVEKQEQGGSSDDSVDDIRSWTSWLTKTGRQDCQAISVDWIEKETGLQSLPNSNIQQTSQEEEIVDDCDDVVMEWWWRWNRLDNKFDRPARYFRTNVAKVIWCQLILPCADQVRGQQLCQEKNDEKIALEKNGFFVRIFIHSHVEGSTRFKIEMQKFRNEFNLIRNDLKWKYTHTCL